MSKSLFEAIEEILELIFFPVFIVLVILWIIYRHHFPSKKDKAIEKKLQEMENSRIEINKLYKQVGLHRMSIEDILQELKNTHETYGLPANSSPEAFNKLVEIMGYISTNTSLSKCHCEELAEMLFWQDIQNVWVDCSVRIHILNALERFQVSNFDPSEYLEYLEKKEEGKKFPVLRAIWQEEKKVKELIKIWEARKI